jgi:hypothetical protein
MERDVQVARMLTSLCHHNASMPRRLMAGQTHIYPGSDDSGGLPSS